MEKSDKHGDFMGLLDVYGNFMVSLMVSQEKTTPNFVFSDGILIDSTGISWVPASYQSHCHNISHVSHILYMGCNICVYNVWGMLYPLVNFHSLRTGKSPFLIGKSTIISMRRDDGLSDLRPQFSCFNGIVRRIIHGTKLTCLLDG